MLLIKIFFGVKEVEKLNMNSTNKKLKKILRNCMIMSINFYKTKNLGAKNSEINHKSTK